MWTTWWIKIDSKKNRCIIYKPIWKKKCRQYYTDTVRDRPPSLQKLQSVSDPKMIVSKSSFSTGSAKVCWGRFLSIPEPSPDTGPDRIRRPQRPSDQTILLYTILWSDARGCYIDMEEFTNVTGGKGWCWILRPTANEPTTTVTTVTSSRILCIENYVYVQVLRKFTGKQTWSNLKLLHRVLVSHLRASQSTRY